MYNLAPPKTHPAQPGSKSEEINGDSQKGEKAKTVPGEGKNPTPPSISVPTIAAGIAKVGSDQNTDPISHDTPPLVGNADPLDVEPTDSHSQVQPSDPQHINDAAETVEGTRGNNPTKFHPLHGIQVDPKKKVPSESSPAGETKEDHRDDKANKSDPTAQAIEDSKNGESSSNKVPGKSNPADEIIGESRNENPNPTEPSAASELDPTREPGKENPSRPHSSDVAGDTREKEPSNIDPSTEVMGGSKIENPKEVNLPIKGAQDPSMEDTNKSDLAHETMEDPKKEDTNKPRPLTKVMKGNGENNPTDADPIVGGTGNKVLGELNVSDTNGDSKEKFTNSINPPFGSMGDVRKDRSSDLDLSGVYPGNENLSALGQLLDITKDPQKAHLDELDPSFKTTSDPGKDTSSNSNPPVKLPAPASSSELESSFETPTLPTQKDPSESNPSNETSIDSETSQDPTQPNGADKLIDLPHQNDETHQFDPFHTSPAHPHRIEAALSLSAQEAQLPPEPTQTKYNHPNQHNSPAPFGAFDPARQTDPFPRSQSTQILNPQSSSLNNNATITATPVPASENFRATLPSNGTLNTPMNVTGNISATSWPNSAGITAGSVINSPSAARTDSAVSNDHANVASGVGAMDRRAWMAVGVLMFFGGVIGR